MVGYIRKFSHIYIHIYILECKRASEINIYLVNVERENIAIPTATHSYTLFYPVTSRAILFNEFSTLSLMVHSRALAGCRTRECAVMLHHHHIQDDIAFFNSASGKQHKHINTSYTHTNIYVYFLLLNSRPSSCTSGAQK